MIDWTFTDKTGKRLGSAQTDNTQLGYDQAGRLAQKLANEHQTTVNFTAWLEHREGATSQRYPRKRGRPASANALTNAERQAAFRQKKRADGICPCCNQPLPKN